MVQEAIKLWKQVAGPPEMTEGTTMAEMLELWMSGRCAMTISGSPAYTVLRSTPLKIGTAIMPGSEKVWEREGKKTAMCNQSLCRHATEYQDGLVVNHAPAGQSVIDGAINGQIGKAQQLAAYTFLTWADERRQHGLRRW